MWKRCNVSKNTNIHFTQVNFAPISKAFSWLSVFAGGKSVIIPGCGLIPELAYTQGGIIYNTKDI